MRTIVAFALAALLGGGCYMRPSWSNNPLHSPEGVRARLVGEDCEDHRGASSDPISRDLGVKLLIENPTDKRLRISEQSIRLVVGDYTTGVRFPGVAEVRPHASAIVTWSFTHHSLCEADREFVIAWNDALALDNHPVRLESLAFKP